MGRGPCCDKANVKKGPWSPEEDAILKSYIHKFGTGGNWIALPTKIGLKRCGKSCRLRWLNYLRPNLKHGDFTDQEDNIICSLYISIGSRWSVIANQLPGRTDNDIKNYWNTKLKKKLLGLCSSSSSSLLGNLQNDLISNSALERLQLHLHLLNHNKLNQTLLNPMGHTQHPATVGMKPQNIGLLNSAADEAVNCLITTSAAPDTTTTTTWFSMNMTTKTDDHQTDNYMRSSSSTSGFKDDAAGGDDVMNQQQQQQQEEEVAWWSNEEQVVNWDYSPITYIC